MKEPWAVFYLGDKELAAYTLRGTFSGEAEALPVLTGCALGLGGCALGLWWYGRKDIAA